MILMDDQYLFQVVKFRQQKHFGYGSGNIFFLVIIMLLENIIGFC